MRWALLGWARVVEFNFYVDFPEHEVFILFR